MRIEAKDTTTHLPEINPQAKKIAFFGESYPN